MRRVFQVAAFELAESLRSRKVLVFLVLYVAGSVGATVLFTEFLQTLEEALAAQLLVASTSTPGNLTQAMMDSPELLRILRGLVRDEDLARALVQIPPVALLYHWVALTFAPIFVMITSSDAISAEVSSGSIRFALVRSGRADWVAGKVVGQGVLLAVGLALGAVGAFVTGAIQLASFDYAGTAGWMVRYVGTAFAFSAAFLGLATLASQLVRRIAAARALSLMLLVSVFAIPRFLDTDMVTSRVPVLAGTLRSLFPVAQRLDLWRPDLSDVLPACAILFAFAIAMIALGYVRFSRRDT